MTMAAASGIWWVVETAWRAWPPTMLLMVDQPRQAMTFRTTGIHAASNAPHQHHQHPIPHTTQLDSKPRTIIPKAKSCNRHLAQPQPWPKHGEVRDGQRRQQVEEEDGEAGLLEAEEEDGGAERAEGVGRDRRVGGEPPSCRRDRDEARMRNETRMRDEKENAMRTNENEK